MFNFSKAMLLVGAISQTISLCGHGAVVSGTPAAKASNACRTLKNLVLADTTIMVAQSVPAGGGAVAMPEIAAQPASGLPSGPGTLISKLAKAPSFCRVAGSITPSPDSLIGFEVWLPTEQWIGKLQGIGEGGFAGYIAYDDLVTSISRGYAAASTDTGHKASPFRVDWALNHPEKVKDWNYRAVHLTAVAAKSIISAFYGRAAWHSYYSGCSGGGRQGLTEAQRFPADYDGVLSGDAGSFAPGLAQNLWLALAQMNYPAALLSQKKLSALHAAALKACDKSDGLADGIISEPLTCHFDPSVTLCRGSETDECLTQPQIETAHKFYAGLRRPDGTSYHLDMLPGSELGWSSVTYPTPATSLLNRVGEDWFRYVIYGDPTWSIQKFNLDRDLGLLMEKTGPDEQLNHPDLSGFAGRGGKLILYTGFADPIAEATTLIDYVHNIESRMGPAAAQSVVSLFLVPAMGHCGGGDGPNYFHATDGIEGPADPTRDMSAALETWVEKGRRPDMIIASQYEPPARFTGPTSDAVLVRTRPICAFPKVAHWTGSGSSDSAANFVCEEPAPTAP